MTDIPLRISFTGNAVEDPRVFNGLMRQKTIIRKFLTSYTLFFCPPSTDAFIVLQQVDFHAFDMIRLPVLSLLHLSLTSSSPSFTFGNVPFLFLHECVRLAPFLSVTLSSAVFLSLNPVYVS